MLLSFASQPLSKDSAQVLDFLEGQNGRCNRAAMMGAYSSSPGLIHNHRHLTSPQVDDALRNLGGAGLISINSKLEVEIEADTFRVFSALRKDFSLYNTLVTSALEAQKNSWSPYSKFKVGAAVLATDGKVYLGTNFENASYGVTICAERCAIGAAVVNGSLNPKNAKFIKAVCAVIPTPEYGRPCGACRQAIYEFSIPNGETLVIMANMKGEADVKLIRQLLPDAFGPLEVGILQG